MSIILITLLFMGSVLSDPPADVTDPKIDYTVTGPLSPYGCKGQGAVEVGGILKFLNKPKDHWEMHFVTDLLNKKLQEDFKTVCESAPEVDTERLFRQKIEEGHPKFVKNEKETRAICCIRLATDICGGSDDVTDIARDNKGWIKSCSKDKNQCEKDKEDCKDVPRGVAGEGKKVCCKKRGTTTEKKCPGGLDALGVNSKCSALKKDGYDYDNMCCPKMVHHNWIDQGAVGYGWNLEADVEATTKTVKICKKNEECGDGRFCDEARHQLNKIKATDKVCFRDPVFVGKAVKKEPFGLADCFLSGHTCEKGQFCAKEGSFLAAAWQKYSESIKATGNNIAGVCFQVEKCATKPNGENVKEVALSRDDSGPSKGYPQLTNEISDGISLDEVEVFYAAWDNGKLIEKKKYAEAKLYCPYKTLDLGAYCKEFNGSQPAWAPLKVPKNCNATTVCSPSEAEIYHGSCKMKKGSEKGLCCQELKCPGTDMLMAGELACKTASDCLHSEIGSDKAQCLPNNQTGKSHCCPIVYDTKVTYTYTTNVACSNLDECVDKKKKGSMFRNLIGIYCKDTKDGGKCAFTGTGENAKATDTNCQTNADCKDKKGQYQGVCAQNAGSRVCFGNPYDPAVPWYASFKAVWLYSTAGFTAAAFLCLIMAIIFFLKYRSRHMCDHRKKKKNNKKDKKKGGSSKTAASEKEKTGATAGDKTEATGAEQSGTTAGGTTGATGAEKSGATSAAGTTGATSAAGTTGATGATTGGDQSKAESVQQ